MREKDEQDFLLKPIVELWVVIHGFAYTSRWMKGHKQINLENGAQKTDIAKHNDKTTDYGNVLSHINSMTVHSAFSSMLI